MQTRKGSFIESLTNIAVGYLVALVTQLLVFPLVGVKADLKQNVEIGLIFTIISIARSYTIRRLYNKFNWFGCS